MSFSTFLGLPHIWADVAYASGAIACITVLGIFWRLRGSIRKRLTDSATSVEELITRLDTANNEIEKLSHRIYELEQRSTPAPEYISAPASVNLNRRGQVIQLHRRGKEAAAIASALKVSQGEVQLIIKIHDLTQSGFSEQTSEGFPLKSRPIVR